MEEIWKEIAGYEGLYQVSNMGRVKSLDRVVKISTMGSIRLVKSRILKPNLNTHGYLYVNLSKEGKVVPKKVHRLIAEAFIPNPDNKPFIDHINTVTTDNRIENLRWCTQKENMNNPISIENCKNTNKNKSVAQYSLEGELIAVYPSVMEAARQTGCNNASIHSCCNGGYYRKGKLIKYTKHKGFKWKYYN